MSDTLSSHEHIINRLKGIRPSESVIYFTGFLEEERLRNPLGPANAIATLAYSLYGRGLLHLTQRRKSLPITKFGTVGWIDGMGKGFDYIATGAIPKKQPYQWT